MIFLSNNFDPKQKKRNQQWIYFYETRQFGNHQSCITLWTIFASERNLNGTKTAPNCFDCIKTSICTCEVEICPEKKQPWAQIFCHFLLKPDHYAEALVASIIEGCPDSSYNWRTLFKNKMTTKKLLEVRVSRFEVTLFFKFQGFKHTCMIRAGCLSVGQHYLV